MKYLYASLFLIFSLSAIAQNSVEVQVINAENEVLTYASVLLKGTNFWKNDRFGRKSGFRTCSAALAYPFFYSENLTKADTTLVIACGGVNTSFEQLENYRMRFLE